MKKTISLALIAFFTLGLPLMAQNRNNSDRMGRRAQTEQRWTAKNRAEQMAERLKLTEEQKKKVEALFEKQDAKRAEQLKLQQEKREQMSQDRESRREEMQQLREKALTENDAELEKIIGKEKMAQWKSYREEMRKKMQDANRSDRRTPRRNAPKAGR
ncbi:MAG: hypothetical protein WC112_06420 [Proteiniphilum sp.]